MAEKSPAKSINQKKKPFVDNLDLPASYNKTNLTLIARDPHWIFAYWELASSTLEEWKTKIGQDFYSATRVLRMYDVTLKDFNGSNANQWFDLSVGNAENWYISMWSDNVSYCADLGLRFPDGRFFGLVRSNVVTTPRVNPSGRNDQVWMNVEDNSVHKSFAYGNINNPHSQHSGNKAAANNPFKSKRINLDEDDIRMYYSRLSPSLRDVISERLARNRSSKTNNSGRPSVSINNDTRMFENFTLNKANSKRRAFAGASGMIESPGASESLVKGASEMMQPVGRKFFFEIGTELIVYGRTEPDAEVRMNDRKIDLRSDGTFGMRFALPDGNIPLDFTAISGDKVEKRTITTAVERLKTKRKP